MPTTSTPQKRPRIASSTAETIADMNPDLPFERAVNRALGELVDVRHMLAESILDLEGERGTVKDFMDRRTELAVSNDARALVRILRLRLRDRGVEL